VAPEVYLPGLCAGKNALVGILRRGVTKVNTYPRPRIAVRVKSIFMMTVAMVVVLPFIMSFSSSYAFREHQLLLRVETALGRCRRHGNSSGDVECAKWVKKRERTHIIIEQVEPHRRVECPQKVTHGSPLPATTQLLQLLRVYCVVARVPWCLGQLLCWWRRHPTSGGLEASVRFVQGKLSLPNGIYPQTMYI